MNETWKPNPEIAERIKIPASQIEAGSENRGDRKIKEFFQKIGELRGKLLAEGEPSPAATDLWGKLIEWHERLERPGYYDFDQTSEKITQQLTGQKETDVLAWSDIEDYPPNQKLLQTMTGPERKILQNMTDCLLGARLANLEQRVTTDVLCRDLYNRRYFESLFLHEVARVKKISEEQSQGMISSQTGDEHERPVYRGKSYVLVFDINDFGEYNKEYGHLRGDQVLRDMAKTMKGIFQRQSDVLARVGGDEFALIARSHTEENLAGFLKKFIAEMSQQGINIGVGVSEIQPTDSSELEESWQCAYHRADLAGKLAKDMTKKGIDEKPFQGIVISSPDPAKKRTKHHHYNFLEAKHD